ncbi:hypothetical protein SARC_00978 [Sphaeroforma arctica JP610]|uniref:peptidylprolyl isomerase n=1 Tax=Sphaeroforma arctica JP610 TaxID=667725 RepID=A0A0L0GEZ7_9EUKA|nr:hypothetical protein SARC_00978 [Sphaeroforma arctica JP610]KNC86883.1 hypothetical protein SARC_00978 [Sphaeroforma arctica JP610]|eukprot:XP_014160785.1 hypothetical protein SARC_00978 [Sphaeroforma arctica JP610]
MINSRSQVLHRGDEDGNYANIQDSIEAHLIITLSDGSEVVNTRRNGYTTTKAVTSMNDGMTEGLQMMKIGDHFQFFIPSEKRTGASYGDSVYPGDVLIYDVEVFDIMEPNYLSWTEDPKKILGVLVFLYFGLKYFRDDRRKLTLPLVTTDKATAPTNTRVYMDISIGGEAAGRIVFELFNNITPRTATNFRCICTGEKGKSSNGLDLNYKGVEFHQVKPGFLIQGGDISKGKRMSESIYGGRFKDEWTHGTIQHSKAGLLSMANAGKDTNGSQFFILLGKAEYLDGKHVVFGMVDESDEDICKVSYDVLDAISAVGAKSGKPKKKVVVESCGVVQPTNTKKRL